MKDFRDHRQNMKNNNMKKKKDLNQEINEFLKEWDIDEMSRFLKNVIPLIENYDLDEDWLKDKNEEDEINVRYIRTVYLLSRIADLHASKLCRLNVQFKNLWKRMENQI